jgi:hypothetical protein
MSTDCGEQKLRGLYQDLLLPAITARDIKRITDRRTATPFPGGLTAATIVYPLWGEIQEL